MSIETDIESSVKRRQDVCIMKYNINHQTVLNFFLTDTVFHLRHKKCTCGLFVSLFLNPLTWVLSLELKITVTTMNSFCVVFLHYALLRSLFIQETTIII